MASAVLVSRNETSNFLSSSKNHRNSSTMGKIPFHNPNPNPKNNQTQFSRKQLNYPLQNGGEFGNSFTVSDDASSFNQHRKVVDVDDLDVNGGVVGGGVNRSLSHYVSYNIANLSRSEIRLLKSRLISELDKVRLFSSRIESSNTNNNHKKRPLPSQPAPSRGAKRHEPAGFVASPQVMKMCVQVLTKVMKQKAGYVFNEPVDVVGMGLHDYHQIVKRPMDLGTIKRNLGEKGFYSTPEEFADDVRLTFNNALIYNPKGHEVHNLAEKFLAKFEQYFRPVYHRFQLEKQQSLRHQPRPVVVDEDDDVGNAINASTFVVDEVQWSKKSSPEPPVTEVPLKKPEPRVERVSEAVEVAQEVVAEVGRKGSSGKLPKPKAKDPNKREMSMEEKQRLGAGLQSLPDEKMSQVIHIIRKRNGHLTQEGDEIELDIEAVDTETLWELDRFVTNYKKMVSKLRRQALMQNNNVDHSDDHNQVDMSERMTEMAKAVKRGGGDVGDEDVDIGDEMPMHNFPPVEIDKDDDRNQGGGGGGGGGASSSSSSSGSDSSSSSDSDSGSSSGSDSDVDDAQSRDNESKNIPH